MESHEIALLAHPACSSSQTPLPWHLESFTEEILGLTCSFSGLEALTRLFCCGSSLLRKKLDSPSCRLELKWIGGTSLGGNRPWKKFPPFIAALKGVKGVTLIEPKRGNLIPPSHIVLNSCLPSTLEALHIMSSLTHELLENGKFKNLTSLCVRESKESNPRQTEWDKI